MTSTRKLTYVHGKVYDMTQFIDRHPGGRVAIELCLNRDSTQLVRSYHPFTTDKVLAILQKYEVTDATEEEMKAIERIVNTDGNVFFDWTKQSEFEKDLKSQVKPILDQTGTKADWVRMCQILVLSLCVILMTIPYIKGYWWTLLAYPVVHWLWIANVLHDASHFSMAKRWRVNHLVMYVAPWFSSPFSWYHEHVIGHHVYTNLEQDPDLHHGWWVWKYHDNMHYKSWFKWQKIYTAFVWSTSCIALAGYYDIIFALSEKYHGVVQMIPISRTRKAWHYFGRVFNLALMFVLPHFNPYLTPTQAAIWGIVPYMVLSFCFAFCSQLNHITPQNLEKHSSDWYKHQVITSHSFAPQSIFWTIVTGGLNLQIEHHLFPGINGWHLRKIQPIVEACCKKHNIYYHLSATTAEAVQKHVDHIAKMGVDPAEKLSAPL